MRRRYYQLLAIILRTLILILAFSAYGPAKKKRVEDTSTTWNILKSRDSRSLRKGFLNKRTSYWSWCTPQHSRKWSAPVTDESSKHRPKSFARVLVTALLRFAPDIPIYHTELTSWEVADIYNSLHQETKQNLQLVPASKLRHILPSTGRISYPAHN
jgi:hypothetical protein